MFVQLIGGAWVPARHPFVDADGKKFDKIEQLDEKPGRRAAAGIYPSVFEQPEGEDVLSWDGGTLAAGVVTFRAAETVPADPDVSIEQLARALPKTALPDAIVALEAAEPGLLMAALLMRLLGVSEAAAMLRDLGATDVPAAQEIREVAVAEKAADVVALVKGLR